jgi:hypothetical protein
MPHGVTVPPLNAVNKDMPTTLAAPQLGRVSLGAWEYGRQDAMFSAAALIEAGRFVEYALKSSTARQEG